MYSTSGHKRNFKFVWRIENLGLHFQRKNRFLRSPPFTAETLHNTNWLLSLWPKVNQVWQKECIEFSLIRYNDPHPSNIVLDITIQFKSGNGELLVAYNFKPHEFRKDREHNWYQNVDFKFKNINLLMVDDVLILECCMSEVFPIREPVNFCLAHSDMSLDRFTFKWFIENFKSLDCDCSSKKTFFSGKTNIEIVFRVREQDIKITVCDTVFKRLPLLMLCKITLLDANGFETDSEQSEHLFEKGKKDWKFPMFFKKSKLFSEERRFLKNGVLAFRCEFALSHNKMNTYVQEYKHDFDEDCSSSQNMAAFCSLTADVRRGYHSLTLAGVLKSCDSLAADDRPRIHSLTLADVLKSGDSLTADERPRNHSLTLADVLKSDNEMYPCHKNFLSARSPSIHHHHEDCSSSQNTAAFGSLTADERPRIHSLTLADVLKSADGLTADERPRYRSLTLADVLKSDDEMYSCHKNILSTRSPSCHQGYVHREKPRK